MAIISAYPVGTPASGDYLVGSDITTAGTQINPTKNFVISEVVDTGLGYVAYASIVTQAGVVAPTEVILKNGTVATMTWARTGAGVYTCTASAPIFTATKTWMTIGLQNNGSTMPIVRTSDTQITVTTSTNDNRITNASFEVRIYT